MEPCDRSFSTTSVTILLNIRPQPYLPADASQLPLKSNKIGLLLQLDSFHYPGCLPLGLRMAATKGTDNLTATGQASCLNKGGMEHDSLGLYVPRVPLDVVPSSLGGVSWKFFWQVLQPSIAVNHHYTFESARSLLLLPLQSESTNSQVINQLTAQLLSSPLCSNFFAPVRPCPDLSPTENIWQIIKQE